MQGFNMGRYIPPEALERGQSLNQASGKGHALGKRARPDGGLIVRFELPFAVWCTTCAPEQIIGQGVRFNAEKKKVGNYYSTPIWAFRFKHTTCSGTIEVRTDPKSAEYVVVEGGRRRDYGEVRDEEWGVIKPGATEEEKQRLEKEGGFAALEKVKAEKTEKETQQRRVTELWMDSERRWGDPYEMSRVLRREFRVGRRQRQNDAKTAGLLGDKYGLDVELLAPSADDARQAGEVDFGQSSQKRIDAMPLFAQPPGAESDRRIENEKRGKTDKAKMQTQHRTELQGMLKGNTLANHNPFLGRETAAWEPHRKRRKQAASADDDNGSDGAQQQETMRKADNRQPTANLVTYDSDTD